jgi:Flp pilus assembly protein TadG
MSKMFRRLLYLFTPKIRDERGASIIETALVSMLLLLMIGGTIDLGGAFQNFIIITNAAREGARMAARVPCKADNRALLRAAIVQAVINEAANSNLTLADGNVTIDPDPVGGPCAEPGEPIEVLVTVPYQTLLGALWGGAATINVANSATMAYAGGD